MRIQETNQILKDAELMRVEEPSASGGGWSNRMMRGWHLPRTTRGRNIGIGVAVTAAAVLVGVGIWRARRNRDFEYEYEA